VRAALHAPTTPCRLCGAAETTAVCVSAQYGVTVLLCGACGVLFSAGRAGPRDYQMGYWDEAAKAQIGQSNRVVGSRRRHLEVALGKPVAGLRVLEVGVGRGEYAQELVRHGAQVLGLEPQADMAALLREKLGIAVESKYLQQVAPTGQGYDVINLSHVLEHIEDPVSALLHAGTLLNVGGVVALEVPNAEVAAGGNLERFFFDELTHVYHFSRPVLQRVARAAGMELAGLTVATCKWWGPRAALRAVLRPVSRQQPLEPAAFGEAAATLQQLMRQHAKWRLYGGPVREARLLAGSVARRLLPDSVIAGYRARRAGRRARVDARS
jgi:SAM-dependent methyltransferase